MTSTLFSLDMVYDWFSSCLRTHSKCRQPLTQPTTSYPTRLLDLGPKDSGVCRLIITAEAAMSSPHEPYLTLSYRWGTDPGLLLLSSTLHEFRQGKPISVLPKTFQDLVTVARKFSIRYVWIDALCIIQDSPEDWEVEALKMRTVYANSACTVAASVSSNESEGLFRFRDAASFKPGLVNMSLRSGKTQICQIFERDYWNTNIFSGPLHKRGWVFQERHLSTRIIYFANNQILWECLEGAKCEGFPEGIPHHYSDKDLDQLWQLREKEAEAPGDANDVEMPGSVYVLWRDLVKKYTGCSFTKVDDKLPAFAGIAKLFQEITRDEYIAGLWRSRLLEGLDWRVYEPKLKASLAYRAPSWS